MSNIEQTQRVAATMTMPRDPNTLSNYHNFLTTHTKAHFDVDFVNERLTGNVILKLKSITDAESREVVLDTSHLDIKHVKLDRVPLKWNLLPRSEPYGSALKIELEKAIAIEESIEIDVCLRILSITKAIFNDICIYQIHVQTTKECTALQWLTPAQTSNKKHPYMCQ